MAELEHQKFEELENSLEDEEVILVIAPTEDVESTNISILKHFSREEDFSSVYVTLTKPYKTVENVLEKEDVKTDRIFYIDCITKVQDGDAAEAENVVFLEPQALTNISIALSNAVESLPESNNNVLIFDTLSTLIMYNDEETVSKFAHQLSSKIRGWGIRSILLTLREEQDDELIENAKSFADKTVHID